MDRITLTGLSVFGHHGVHPEERRDGQRFVVDAVLYLDLSISASNDDVRDTVDYSEVADVIVDIVGGEPRNLLEAVAREVADEVLKRFPRVRAMDITLHKPEAPLGHDLADVSVTFGVER